jgi:UDP-N-acetylmuramate--alanine ligase
VILTMGAGDVTKAVQPILKEIKQKGPKLKIGILCGGTSAEHPVSLMSARNVISALDPSVYEMKIFGLTREGDWLFGANALALLEQKNYLRSENGKISDLVLRELSQCDLCIPVFHGLQGEDGMIQGFLDTLQIPYAGCDYRASALCMQKTWTKQIAQMNNVPTAPYFQITQAEYRRNASLINQKIEKELHYPVWIKPVHLGSSIGVSRVDDAHGVSKAVDLAFYYDDTVIVERHVEGRQVEFSLIGNETLRMALPAEVLSDGAFHDYESKYGPNAAKFSIPPDISDLDQKIGMELAEKMYRSAGCKGLARIDFFYDFQGHFWFNEINPFPGITDTSAFPQSWKKTNISLSMLCDELIAAGLQRSRRLMEIRGH